LSRGFWRRNSPFRPVLFGSNLTLERIVAHIYCRLLFSFILYNSTSTNASSERSSSVPALAQPLAT
jgi:hypothetical protein